MRQSFELLHVMMICLFFLCCDSTASAASFFEHACNPIVKQRWHHAFIDIYHEFLSSSSLQCSETSNVAASSPPLWMGTVPLPILYVAYAVLVEKGVSVTDDALLQVVTQPEMLFKGYQDVQVAAMQEHQYGMVRGAAAAAYAQVFETMAEAGSLDYMLKAESSLAAAADDDDDKDDDPNREIAWWCIPPDSDMSKGKDALAALVGQWNFLSAHSAFMNSYKLHSSPSKCERLPLCR
jgi:hypothetical protein